MQSATEDMHELCRETHRTGGNLIDADTDQALPEARQIAP